MGFRVEGFRLQGLGFWGSGFRVLAFRVLSSGRRKAIEVEFKSQASLAVEAKLEPPKASGAA